MFFYVVGLRSRRVLGRVGIVGRGVVAVAGYADELSGYAVTKKGECRRVR